MVIDLWPNAYNVTYYKKIELWSLKAKEWGHTDLIFKQEAKPDNRYPPVNV